MSTLSRTPFIGLTFAAVIAALVLLFGGVAHADTWGGHGGWGMNHGFFGHGRDFDRDFDDFHHNFFNRDFDDFHHNFFDRDDFHHHNNNWGWGGGWGW